MAEILKKFILITLLFQVFTIKLWSQGNEIFITAQCTNLPLSELIANIEEFHKLDFYFLEKTITGKFVTGNFIQTPLKEFLQQVVQQNLINFYIDGSHVYLYSGPEIKEDFTANILQEYRDIQIDNVEKDIEELRKQEYKIINIGIPRKTSSKMVALRGVVKSFHQKSPVVDGNVIAAGTNRGSSTNLNGAYELMLEKGNHIIQFSSIGMKPTQRMINIYSDGELNVEMETQMMMIGNVDIFGNKQETVSHVRSGIERMDEQTIKSLPALLGEPDVMRTTLMMPGVQTVGEGVAGFNVRGGKTDQNLILVDGAPLFYPSHFFGNFSAINSDMVKETILYKGSIPAKYGGRISSVYEINTKDGSTTEIRGTGGISLLSVKAMLEGPIHKKSTFAVSTRSTYSDYILNLIKIPDLYNSQVYFNDIQAKINLVLSEKDELKFGYYLSNDKYQLHSDTLYKYNNRIATAKYIHNHTEKWQSEVALYNSFFAYNISSEQDLGKSFFMTHDVQNAGLKNFNEYKNNEDLKLNFGMEFNAYKVNPGNLNVPDISVIKPFISEIENAVELGTFAGFEFAATPRLVLETGVRLSGFFSIDDGYRYIYAEGKPITEDNIIDTITGNRNQIKETYFNPELRFSANFLLNSSSSLKLGYNTTTQYIHILTNSTAISPTDTWKLSDEFLLPQLGKQVSLGIFKSINNSELETSIEGFYKKIDNLKEYKPGATIAFNNHIETEILDGIGKSFGVEFSLKKNMGRLNGWVNYTYARTFIKSNSPFESELVNGGEYFPASYDKPHNLNVFANMKASRRIILSSILNYSTGRPITYPVAKYQLGEQVILHYSKFNQYRIPDYFRIDSSVTIKGSLKSNKKVDSSFTFSIYNITARRNAYSVFFKSNGDSFEGYRLSVFGTAVPTMTYNFSF